ncbi:hypothetical protein AB0C97_36855 [Streptomyces goshikiensis]|uniref:hypothetical protein n=1 Tax=Streptomyces goshikiensis TaxID=1942 RepID=UPI0033FF92E3
MGAYRAGTGDEEQDRPPMLTIRVSRDGGRTYGPARVIPAGSDLEPLLTSQWPPCRCPRHCPAT